MSGAVQGRRVTPYLKTNEKQMAEGMAQVVEHLAQGPSTAKKTNHFCYEIFRQLYKIIHSSMCLFCFIGC
jgi:hypothetical protein